MQKFTRFAIFFGWILFSGAATFGALRWIGSRAIVLEFFLAFGNDISVHIWQWALCGLCVTVLGLILLAREPHE
jgi:hypothetical protein